MKPIGNRRKRSEDGNGRGVEKAGGRIERREGKVQGVKRRFYNT